MKQQLISILNIILDYYLYFCDNQLILKKKIQNEYYYQIFGK
jgi:hypothetical protein